MAKIIEVPFAKGQTHRINLDNVTVIKVYDETVEVRFRDGKSEWYNDPSAIELLKKAH